MQQTAVMIISQGNVKNTNYVLINLSRETKWSRTGSSVTFRHVSSVFLNYSTIELEDEVKTLCSHITDVRGEKEPLKNDFIRKQRDNKSI